MGFLVLTESQSFIPANHGITDKSIVTAIVVGGGAGGSSYAQGTEYKVGEGGAAGCGGKAFIDVNYTYAAGGGGGGGGGFGAGGGGGAGYNSNGRGGGAGGGAGEVVVKNIIFDDPTLSVNITVAGRAPADTAGEATSIGNLIVAEGGKVGGGGKGYSSGSTEGGGGGGGEGGFQLGVWMNMYRTGGDAAGRGSSSNRLKSGSGSGSGGGAGGMAYCDPGSGGPYGGGSGGTYANSKYNDGEDGKCYLGEAGKGVVVLFW